MTIDPLEPLLTVEEPCARARGTVVLAIHTDYLTRRLVADLDIPVGDPTAPDDERRERRRRGQLVVEGLRLWAIEPPDRTHRPPKGLLLRNAALLSETPTDSAATLRITVGESGICWSLYFDDINAYAYLAGDRARFTWC